MLTALFCGSLFVPAVLAQDAASVTEHAGLGHPLITQSVDESRLATLKGNVHPLARTEFDLGMAPASLPMQRMLLVLKRSPAQQAQLTKLLDEQQDKSSPNFHRWLTPESFGNQFGPSDEDIQTIKSWLQSHGFQVGSTKGRTVLEFSGSASQVEETFHTAIHKYVVEGQQHWANANDPQIPAALTSVIAGIDSLHNFPKVATSHYVGKYSAKTRQLESREPNYTFNCGGNCFGIVPYDFAAIYDVLPLWTAGIDGTGQTIAIVGRTDIHADDAKTFWHIFGLTVPQNKLHIITNGDDPGFTGDEDEADIDVQWSGAVAPQATIDFVTSASTDASDGVDLSALYIVENNLAPVMSESYGQCELGLGTAGNQFFKSLWEQAAAQGISVFISTGDNMAAGCDNPGGPAQYGLNVNGIASTPFNAAIGGTDFNQYQKESTYWNSTNDPVTFQSAKGYIPETTWNDSCTNALAITLGFGSTAEKACNNAQMIQAGGVNSEGGSGGPSNCAVNTRGVLGSCTQGYAKPSWQKGTGVPADSKRDLPDVSLFASNGFLGSFYVICDRDLTGGVCNSNNFAAFGGTSVSSPAFAGIMSLVNQATGEAQGVPGYALYQLASKQPNAFHDVPSGSTIGPPCVHGSPNCTVTTNGDQYGVLSGYSTGAGYDLATGLGTVDVANLVDNWSKATFTATTATLQLNHGTAVSVVHGTAVPVNIGVTPAGASGEAVLLMDTGGGLTSGRTLGVFPLTGGSASGTTSLLPGGTYNLAAHYGGDGTYGGAYSTPVSVTVTKENSTVAFSGLQLGSTTVTTVKYDDLYVVRADVKNSQGAFCNPPPGGSIVCPTGTMTLSEGGTTLGGGSYTVASDGSVLTPSAAIALTAGTHTVKAQYNGDNNYSAGSTSVSITVNPASTIASAPSFQGPDFKQVTLSTSVQDPNGRFNLLAPTGAVVFYSDGTAIPGTVTYFSPNATTMVATLQTSFTAPGTYSITANYAGDQNYLTSTSPATSAKLQYPQPAMALTPTTQTVDPGGTANVTVLVNSGNKTVYPTGTVSFIDVSSGATLAGPTACTNATDGTGHFACQGTAAIPVTSAVQIAARYSGDTNYPASNSGSVTVSVPDFSLNSGSPGFALTQGAAQPVPITVRALSGFTGVVSTFTCSGLPAEATCTFAPAQVTGAGSITVTVSTAAVGQSRRHGTLTGRGVGWIANAMLVVLGACLFGVPSRRRRNVLPVLVIFALFISMPGCGGGGGGSTTPPTNNPVPAIASLLPAQQAVGSVSQSLAIVGSGFMNGSTVTYNGVAHPATFGNASQLSISLSDADLATAGNYPVMVNNPTPGGGPSGSVNFGVVSGTPTGTFNVTVTATSGSLTHTTTFSVVIQ
jgi:hypothetical protein